MSRLSFTAALSVALVGASLWGAPVPIAFAQPSTAASPTASAGPTNAQSVRGAASSGSASTQAPSASAPLMPLSQVRPGMEGTAYTVFRGTKPEPFKMRVVSILRNFIPKQDVILMRAEDPRVEFSGIAAGMSGSPVYIDGKLVGAIAYAWSFSKEPLAGVTPIETMLAEQKRPLRVQHDSPKMVASASTGSAIDEPSLKRVSVPLSVSGVSDSAMNGLADELKPFGLVPVRAGGAGRRRDPIAAGAMPKLEPGAPVGVELVRGDMSAVAMGTLTHVQGNKILAFGHPMFGIGEVHMPMVLGEVHAFLPSLAASFKMASPLQEIGAVVQDRPSCIVGDLSQRATMIPVEVKVTAPGTEERTFRAEVARNRRLTPILASMVVTSAIADAEPDVADMVVTFDSKFRVRGIGSVDLRDQLFTTEGVSPRLLASSRGLRAMGDLMGNPFEPITIDRIDIDVRIEFRGDVAEITGVSLPGGDSVHAGDTVPLRVTLRPYAGQEYTQTVPVTIPRSLAGQTVKIEVASGSLVRPDAAKPESLRGYIDSLRSYYTPSNLVVSLSTLDDGASLRGRLIPNLPQSALDTLRPGNQTRRADAYRVAQRTVTESPRLVNGRQELTVDVREDVLGRNR